MKVLHVITVDSGGAFVATRRIHESLQKIGVNSKILVRSKTKKDSQVVEIFSNPIQKAVSKIKGIGNILLSNENITSNYLGTDISKNFLVKEADIIVLHWIKSFISYKGMEKLLALNKPIVFVLHDTFIFTGGCHVPNECTRYQKECGFCPFWGSKRARDISRKNFLRKRKIFLNNKAIFVGPSEWMVESAKKSGILSSSKDIFCIPNPINTAIFKRLQKKDIIRKKYGIDLKKKVILFGAFDIVREKNKGIRFLKEIMSILPRDEFFLVIFGNADSKAGVVSSLDALNLGYIYSE